MLPTKEDYKKRRVLVVDDDAGTAEMLGRLIQGQLGCEVAECCDSERALARLQESAFDVLLTDMAMPGLHGLELVERVREQSPEVDIVVITGFPNDFPFVEVIQSGASDFITKPCEPGEIAAKLVRIFRERALGEAQEAAQEKYRLLFEQGMNGTLFVQADTYTILDVNKAFCDICAESVERLQGREFLAFFEEQEKERIQAGLALLARNGCGTLSGLTLTRTDGQRRVVDLNVTFLKVAEEQVLMVTVNDVTEKNEIAEQLMHSAERDVLTGLYNRKTFDGRVASAINRARDTGVPVTLILIDLDRFKECNDAYGHQVGDIVLRKAAGVIAGTIRSESDMGFRYGGDEFIVLLPGANGSAGMAAAERMRAEFAEGETYGTSMSIGVTEYPGRGDVAAFVANVDQALYCAKAEGRNTVYLLESAASGEAC